MISITRLMSARLAASVAAFATCAAIGASAERALEADVTASGLESLTWAGVDLLADGAPSETWVVLESVSRDEKGFKKRACEKVTPEAPRSSYDPGTRTLSHRYAFGTFEYAYAPRPDRLDLALTIRNTSDRTIANFGTSLMRVAFSSLPMSADNFSARWTGQVVPRHGEEYTFHVVGDDGVRLWVDGKKLVDAWRNQAPTEYTGTVALQAGKRYDVKLEYYENSGGASARLLWSSPSQTKEVVPSSCLFAAAGSATHGLTGTYFADRSLKKEHLTRVDATVDFDWGTNSPEGAGALGGGGAVRSTLDNLAIVQTAFGAPGATGARAQPTEQVVFCCTTMYPPLRFGLHGAGNKTFKVTVSGGVHCPERGGVETHPLGLPRVAAGQSLTLSFSIRFAPAGRELEEIVADVYAAFREHHGPPLSWPDRRAIGMLMLTSAWSGHKSATNPRGWFNDKRVDVMSEAGRAEFAKRAMKYAEHSIGQLKKMNAQGMIAWDIEGQEMPHPISYIGDPRMSKLMTPEFDAIADAWFRKFLDAGLKTGVCLRPTQVYFHEKKKMWQHGTGSHMKERNPLNDDYEALRPKDLPGWRFFPTAARMSRKIAYCKRRWGCTIFYVDTNGTYRPIGEDNKFKWALVNADVWRAVRAEHPDVLIIPEHAAGDGTFHLASWIHAATYYELDLGGVATPSSVRRVIPGAFSLLNMVDGDIAARRDTLVESVRRGDILMFRGWFGDNRNPAIKAIYDEVYEPGAINPGLDVKPQRAPTVKKKPPAVETATRAPTPPEPPPKAESRPGTATPAPSRAPASPQKRPPAAGIPVWVYGAAVAAIVVAVAAWALTRSGGRTAGTRRNGNGRRGARRTPPRGKRRSGGHS